MECLVLLLPSMAPVTQLRLLDQIPEILSRQGVAEDVRAAITATPSGGYVVVVPGPNETAREAARRAEQALERDREAHVPPPSRKHARIPKERGLRKIDDRTVQTPDGYRFEFETNGMRLYFPGRDDPASVFHGRDVVESDGTAWHAEEANYLLPNRAMFRPEFTEDGELKSVRLVNGEALVDVRGLADPKGDIKIFRSSGGDEWRTKTLEETFGERTYHLGGQNDGGENDVAWHVDRKGHGDLRRVLDDYNPEDRDGRFRLGDRDYHVDPDLKPEFGTPSYERMLRSEVNDIRAAVAGEKMADGEGRDTAELIADFMLGSDGTFDDYAREMAASAGIDYPEQPHKKPLPSALLEAILGQGEDGTFKVGRSTHGSGTRHSTDRSLEQIMRIMRLQQAFGGLMGGTHTKSFDSAMASLAALRAHLAAQHAVEHHYAAALAPALTQIASAGPRLNAAMNYDARGQQELAMAAAMLPVVKAIETVAQSGKLQRFATRAGAIHHDTGAASLRNRFASYRPRDGSLDRRVSSHSDRDEDDYDEVKLRRKPNQDRSLRYDEDNVNAEVRSVRRELDNAFEDEASLARKLVALSTGDRLETLSRLSQDEISGSGNLGDVLADMPEEGGELLFRLIRDAEKAPKKASAQLVRLLEGVGQDWWEGDETLRHALKSLAGGQELSMPGAKEKAAKALAHLDGSALDKIEQIARSGIDDTDLLEVVERARAVSRGLGTNARNVVESLEHGETSLTKESLLGLPSSQRLRALDAAGQSAFEGFVADISGNADQAANLLEQLAEDTRGDRTLGNRVFGRFLKALGDTTYFATDNVLEQFIFNIAGTDLGSQRAQKQAERGLGGLSGTNLTAMLALLPPSTSNGQVIEAIERVRSKRGAYR